MLTPGHKYAAQVYTQLSTQTHINGASHKSGKILSRTGGCQQHLLYSYHTRNILAWTLALPLFQERKDSGRRRRRRLETTAVRDGGMRRQGSDGRTAAHGSWFPSATAARLQQVLTSPRNVPTGQNTLRSMLTCF